MKLVAFTIVLDGEPFIERHLPILQQLQCEWMWVIAHGAAMNGGSTSWCKQQTPRLSTDGTTEYLKAIDRHLPVYQVACDNWDSKDDMVKACMILAETFTKESCVLMEIDSDEIWSVEQLATIVRLFEERPQLASIMFACRYYVGPNLILQGEHCYGDHDYEWLRAWRYTPGQRFVRHEPPILFGDTGENRMTKRESRQLGLVFSHYAYATEAQAEYKEKFYGYKGLLAQWQRLQANDQWPVPLSRFFTHVSGDLPLVVKI